MQKSNNKVVLLTGGNLNDRLKNIALAFELVKQEIGIIHARSSIYESAPWGFEGETNFLNQVIVVTTKLSPLEVLRKCHFIEDQFGRIRNTEAYISRTMDVDILFYNNEIIDETTLVIPHQHLHKRKFTLAPLNELLTDYVHPQLKKTIKDLLKDCDDTSEVHIFDAS